MKSFSRKLKFAGLGLLAVSSVALATVTFNSADGTGYVGKGDVQSAFDMNNTQLQSLFAVCPDTDTASCPLFFRYTAVTKYLAVCEWYTGENSPQGAKLHEGEHKRKSEVRGALAYDTKKVNQVSGFNLLGYGESTESGGSVPVVGGICVGSGDGTSGSGQDGTWTSVTVTSTEGTSLEACLESSTTVVTGKGKNQTSTTTTTQICKPLTISTP